MARRHPWQRRARSLSGESCSAAMCPSPAAAPPPPLPPLGSRLRSPGGSQAHAWLSWSSSAATPHYCSWQHLATQVSRRVLLREDARHPASGKNAKPLCTSFTFSVALRNMPPQDLYDPFQIYCQASGGTDCSKIGKERCTCYCRSPHLGPGPGPCLLNKKPMKSLTSPDSP